MALHSRIQIQVPETHLGSSGVESDVTRIISTPDSLGRLAIEGRVVKTAFDGNLQFVSYFDDGDSPEHPLTAQILNSRIERYKRNGLWKPDAAGDPTRGPNVEFLALLDRGTPVASLRKIHANWRSLGELPSVQKFTEARALTREGLEFLLERSVGRPVVEIAALWKADGFSAAAKFALYMQAFQDSIRRQELWFMGLVPGEYKNTRQAFGERVVRVVGRQIAVNDGYATNTLRLTPIVVDPLTFVDDMLDQIGQDEQKDVSVALLREALLWYFIDGVRGYLDASSRRRLSRLRE